MISNLPVMQEDELKVALKKDLQPYINGWVKKNHPKHKE